MMRFVLECSDVVGIAALYYEGCKSCVSVTQRRTLTCCISGLHAIFRNKSTNGSRLTLLNRTLLASIWTTVKIRMFLDLTNLTLRDFAEHCWRTWKDEPRDMESLPGAEHTSKSSQR